MQQGLKPEVIRGLYGTTKVVPCYKAQGLKPGISGAGQGTTRVVC